jgi:hypothetical protein
MSSKKGNSDDEWIAMGCYLVDSRYLWGKLLLCLVTTLCDGY